MAETKDEDDPQALASLPQKRKPDLDCIERGEDAAAAARGTKKQKSPEGGDLNEGEAIRTKEEQKSAEISAKEEDDGDRRQRARALDKGKGKMVIEEEDESNSDSDTDDSDGAVHGDDEDSDFCEDPLAEVDLENILPSRTRRRAPQEPGAYLVNDLDDDEDEDDEDEDVGAAAAEDDEDSD